MYKTTSKVKPSLFSHLILSALVILICNLSFAQTKKITGLVLDAESSLPLPGVTILVPGTSNGVVSNFDGFYSIDVDPNQQLQFSFIGYKPQTIDVGDNTVINVSLEIGTDVLDEVVVVGYGSLQKRDLTGAISSVKGSSIEKGDPSSIQNALAGRVAGVQVRQNDNGPGSGISVTIRGGSSLTSGNQPLYVIDGFPIIPSDDDLSINPLADLSTSQIESLEILKDASATAIYGAQGANGVIIITTKSGIEGKPKIDVNIDWGISTPNSPPKVISPEDFPNFMINRQQIFNFNNPDSQAQSITYWENITASGVIGSRWFDRITRDAMTKNFNVTYSGGHKGMNYSVSGDVVDQEGVIVGSDFNSVNLNAKLSQKISDNILVGTDLRYSNLKNEGLVNTWEEDTIIKKALQSNPYITDDFDFKDQLDEEDENYSWNNENILTYINEVDNQYETQRFIGNMFLDYRFSNRLNFYTFYGFTKSSKNEHRFLSSNTRTGYAVGGVVNFAKRKTNFSIFQARLNYNNQIKRHKINATAVFESTKNIRENFLSQVQGFEDDSRGVYDLSSAAISILPSNIYADNYMNSYLGRLVYSYNNKYLLTTSLRADGSSKFGKNNKWGYFPSVALGWIVSEERFLQNLDALNLLKFRFSYGVTGNNQIPEYRSLSSLATEKYIFNNTLYSGMVPSSISNADLKWETTTQYNSGVDMGFYNNRISLTLEYYYKKTTDLLLEVQLPTTSGFSTAIKNVGSISNRGLELTLNTVNFDRSDFKWNSSLTFSNNRSKVLDLGEKDEMFFSRNFFHKLDNEVVVRVGDPIGIYYGYVEDQIFNSENEIANSPNMDVLENVVGGIKIYDVNGDGVVTTADKIPIAKTEPEFIGGFNNEFNYKNFDLSFFLRWSYGNDIVNGNITFFDQVGRGNWNTLESFNKNVFSPLNPNGTIHGNVPDTYTNLMRSNYIEDGSFLKCDYITLGYSFPQSFLDSNNLKSLRVYARVSNPFMITRYSWFDPEVSTAWGTIAKVGPGADIGSYPRSTSITAGLTLGL